jgi:hypothetical protein
MNEQEIRDLFREMREEPVPADSLARVRMGVAERIGAERIGRKRWWVPLLAIAGCLIAAFLLLKPVKAPAPVQHPALPEVAQVRLPPETPPAPAPRRPKRARPIQVTVPVSMIRIETPDPEVVILLVN